MPTTTRTEGEKAVDRIVADNDPRNGTVGERLIRMLEQPDREPSEDGLYRAKTGQRYRDDSGYLMDVIKVEPNGDAWVRHPNQKQSGMLTLAAWFDEWELVRDVTDGEGGS